jgi:putative FmdB family regulatory protein
LPLYEFECQECAQSFEELCSVGSKRKPACPKCGSRRTQKIMSGFALRIPGKTAAGGSSSCGSCAGGNCSTCR